MINKSEIKNDLLELLENVFNIEVNNIDENQNLFEFIEMDSLSLIEMLVCIENKFDIELYDEELDFNSFSTLNQIIEVIIRHKTEQLL